jgi:dienelactone hydrolase
LLVAVALAGLVAAACGSSQQAEPTTRPQNVEDTSISWSVVPAPADHHLLLGVVKSRAPGNHIGILLVTGTEGLSTGYPEIAHELAARGFDVAFGCWFGSTGAQAPAAQQIKQIDCDGAPKLVGVAEAAVPDLNALVAGARSALHDYSTLALVGFSRGGGIALLRASTGKTDPVVSVSGMVEGTTNLGNLPKEVNVVTRADHIEGPVLLLHGEADNVVPVTQARDMEQALRAHGADVVAKYYPGADHGLAVIPAVRADVVEQITEFLCARFDCPVGPQQPATSTTP